MLCFYLIGAYVAILILKPTRKFAKHIWPWVAFGCSYDCMRLLPNYMVNAIDIQGVYETEKWLFGISTAEGILTPNEWFAIHHCNLCDAMAGFFYMCWVPVPLLFALYLYFKGKETMCLRFSGAFLFVNIVGFVGYYIHPTAPPWYVMEHGFETVFGTGGSTAGLARFDELIGFPAFASIYVNNSNVFAAIPSLHSAYMMVATYYAFTSKQPLWLVAAFAIICIGIWWTAVYSCHHYIIDVLLGIVTAITGIAIYEFTLNNLKTCNTDL